MPDEVVNNEDSQAGTAAIAPHSETDFEVPGLDDDDSSIDDEIKVTTKPKLVKSTAKTPTKSKKPKKPTKTPITKSVTFADDGSLF
jgi:cell division septation protein DedD